MAKTIGRLKQGDMLIAGEINEKRPAVVDGLMMHYPLDGSLNTYQYSPNGLKVLYEAYNDTAAGYYFTTWLKNNGATVTQSTDLTTVTVATAKQYDLIVADFAVWAVTSALMDQLKVFVDAGISCVAMGNDTTTNVFVATKDSTLHVAHDIVLDDLYPVDSDTRIYTGVGSSDLYGGITTLQNGAKPLYRRADDPTKITGYWYEGPTGAILYFDQEGMNPLPSFAQAITLFAASRTTAGITNTNTSFSDEGLVTARTATNLIASKAQPFFDTSSGWTLLNDTNYTSAIEPGHPGAIYGKGNVLRITDNDGNTSTSEWGGVWMNELTGLSGGSKYTMSIRYKVVGWRTGTIAVWSHEKDSTAVNAERSADYGLPSSTFDGEWHVLSSTKTQTAGYDKRTFTIGMDKTNIGCTIYVDALQFEAGTFLTDFTAGTSSDSSFILNYTGLQGKLAYTIHMEYKHPDMSGFGSNIVYLSSYNGSNTGNWFGLNSGTNTISNFGNPASPTDVWNKAAFVYNGATTTLWLNGVQKGSFAGNFFFTGNVDALSFGPKMGWSGNTFLATLSVRNVSLYNKALAADQIAKLNTRTFSLQKDGSINSNVYEKASGVKGGGLHFPLSVNGMDKGQRIIPMTDTNTVYEDGAVWIGQPATNVVLNTDWSNWTLGYVKDVQYDDRGPNGINSKVISFVDADTDGNGYLYCYGDYAPQAPSTTYTISVWVKTEAPFTFRAYTAANGEVGRQYTNSATVNPGDGWKRVVFNPITTPADTQSASLSFTLDSMVVGKRIWMCAPQMEVGTFATPFTVGTRAVSDLHLPYNTIELNQPFTVLGWWKPYTFGNGAYNGVLTYNNRSSQTTNKRILIMESSTTTMQLRAWLPVDGASEKAVYAGGNVQLGKWNFFAFRRTATDVTLFHGVAGGSGLTSGVNVGSATGIDWLNTAVDSNWGWLIGDYATGSGSTGNGYYRDYTFIPSALSDAEIQTIYKTPMRAYKDNRLQVQGVIREGKVL